MNELDFRRHLKDLAHGRHHIEEHDWAPQPGANQSVIVRRKTRQKADKKRPTSK